MGSSLFARVFKPSQIHHGALRSAGETDLEWFCRHHDVEVAIFPIQSRSLIKNNADQNKSTDLREDIRRDPDKNKRRAFLGGWTDAINGQLYKAVRKRKTHASMGNLFGWIYGKQDLDFRIDTWDRYVDNLTDPKSLD